MTNICTIKNKSGFTVVEMLITIFIITIVGLVVVNFQLDIFSLNKISSSNLVAQEDARRALKTMTAEIRSISQPISGSYAIVEAATSSFSFYSNTDTDSAIEKVRYFLSGTTLKKGVIKPTGSPATTYNPANETLKEIIRNVISTSTPIFSYYNADYDGTSSALTLPVNTLLIRLVKINVIIDDNILKPPTALNMTTQVSIRNLKDNL
jgi:Tfp pilus assembly protein PilW